MARCVAGSLILEGVDTVAGVLVLALVLALVLRMNSRELPDEPGD